MSNLDHGSIEQEKVHIAIYADSTSTAMMESSFNWYRSAVVGVIMAI
jgi:hypothetical protein